MALKTAGLMAAVLGALVLGALSTIGDWIWANYLQDGALLPALIHGILIFLVLAGVLAAGVGTARAWRRLLPSLPLVGFGLAGIFYPLAGLTGYVAALLITWIGMWLALALALRWAQQGSNHVLKGSTFAEALIRGVTAAVGSGVAFWLISGIWTDPQNASAPLSLTRFAAWTFAYFPGLAALQVRARSLSH